MPTHIKTIEVEITEAQMAVLGKDIAHLSNEVSQLEVEKKAAADDFKSQISDKKKSLADLIHRVNRGVDRRDIEVDILINTPEKGQKSFIDVKTGEVVKVEDMTDQDRQGSLFAVDERPDPADSEDVNEQLAEEEEDAPVDEAEAPSEIAAEPEKPKRGRKKKAGAEPEQVAEEEAHTATAEELEELFRGDDGQGTFLPGGEKPEDEREYPD